MKRIKNFCIKQFDYVSLPVSEAMYKEYDQLKNQYELETNTMQQAIERASQVGNESANTI